MTINIDEISKITTVYANEPMSGHTTFRTGGPADALCCPQSVAELTALMDYIRGAKLPYYVIGNGSNLLVGDKGYRGVIVKLLNMSGITVEDTLDGAIISALCGTLLGRIATEALNRSLTGMEGLSGIPGTFGGACVMNAGAYKYELKDILISIDALTESGEMVTIPASELELGYRTSCISTRKLTVVSGKLKLLNGNQDEIRSRMEDFKGRRLSKQPLDKPSAGSTFKRPEGNFAGALIENAGLRGFTIGGAGVSDKHCGFVVNNGQATSEDIMAVIKHVIRCVQENSGITLEPEVRFLGE